MSSGAAALEVTGRGESRRLTPRAVPLPHASVPVTIPARRRWASGLEWGFAAFVIALLAVCGYGFQRIRHAVQDRNHGHKTEDSSVRYRLPERCDVGAVFPDLNAPRPGFSDLKHMIFGLREGLTAGRKSLVNLGDHKDRPYFSYAFTMF